MAKGNDCKCGMSLFHDWFYVVLIFLIGFVFLGVNLGFLSASLLAYWPILLIAIAVKEMIEHR
jgi:hypothetical protein